MKDWMSMNWTNEPKKMNDGIESINEQKSNSLMRINDWAHDLHSLTVW